MCASETGKPFGAEKRVMIVCQLDRYANGARAAQLCAFLRDRGHQVSLVDTLYLGRASDDPRSLLNKLPPLSLRRLGLYALEVVSKLLTRRWRWGRRHLSHYVCVGDYRLRKRILRSAHRLDDFDLVICTTPHDAGILTAPTSARRLYDCPTPWADELWYEGRLTARQHRRLRRLERDLFERVDHLSFHWQTYGCYSVKHYGITGRNLVNLNEGCSPGRRRARFDSPPRVAYLGSLSSQFIDLQLLSRLARLYRHIDVYGGPPPDPRLGLNYLGYASDKVLESYQFGLVTCTRDELRQEGFSAKHLRYLSYGLPVLVPTWRRHLELLRGSLPYDEQSFVSVITALSDRQAWQRVSDEAHAQAQRMTYAQTLAPLDAILREGYEG
jgi:hypothetical protein